MRIPAPRFVYEYARYLKKDYFKFHKMYPNTIDIDSIIYEINRSVDLLELGCITIDECMGLLVDIKAR